MRNFFALCLLFSTLLFACESPKNRDALHRDNTIVIGITSDFDSLLELNAASSDALHVIEEMLFLTLNEIDANLHFQPRLATTWQVSEDGKEIEFKLRDDVFWSDGVPTTAEDVLFTYQLAANPETNYAARSRFAQVERAVVTDRFSIRFYLKSAYPDALFDLQIPILPKHLLQDVPPAEIQQTAFNRKPVGNGPYVLKSWHANDRVIFEANQQYYNSPPAVKHIVFRIIPDEATLAASLLTGEIDILPYVAASKISQLSSDPNLNLITYPDRGYHFLAFNLKRPLLQEPAVRAAAARAVNRREIIETLLAGHGQAISGPIMPYFAVYDSSAPTKQFDLQAAQSLLARAGWRDSDGDGFVEKNGATLSFSMKTNADNQLRSDVLAMLQQQFKKAGIRTTIELVEWGKLVEDVMQNRDFDTVLLSWKTGFTVDPSQVWHSDAIENGFNLGSFRNAEVDSLLDAARAEMDENKAKALWQRFQRRVQASHPYIFLYMQDNMAMINRRVENIEMDVRGYLCDIERWQINSSLKN